MTEYYSLTFQPGGLKILDVPRGESILPAAMQANVHIHGSCGKCRIKLISGEAEGKPSAKLSEEQFAEGYRLACRTKVTSDMEIFIPEESRMGAGDVLEREVTGARKGKLLLPVDLEFLLVVGLWILS